MAERLDLDRPEFGQEAIYPLHWTPALPDAPIDISGLPSIDHSLFLLTSVKFNFSQVYRLFDEEAFIDHIKGFYYGDGVQKASRNRLWFVQFLLMLAFGKAFSTHSQGTGGTVPGGDYFCRAMSLMPDLTSIWQSGVAAIEVLALASLFMYCLDHRQSAHLYVSPLILKTPQTPFAEWCTSAWSSHSYCYD